MSTDDDAPDYGAVCSRCGLSELGAARLRRYQFDPHPCPWCPPPLRTEP